MPSGRDILQLLQTLRDRLDGDVSVETLARAGWSPFHFHRAFRRVVPGLFPIESGCVLAAPTPGTDDMEAASLPGGPAAVAMPCGPYDALSETYAEMERWMEKNGFRPGGAPWESYITDPAEHPDPSDWRTEIYWPLETAD